LEKKEHTPLSKMEPIFMKNLLILCLVTFSGIFPAFADPYAYTIVEHPYRFSTYYECKEKGLRREGH